MTTAREPPRTPEPPIRSPTMERYEQGTALAFAQYRARINGLHVDECLKLIPVLRAIHSDLCDDASRLEAMVKKHETLGDAGDRTVFQLQLSEAHKRVVTACDRLDTSVTSLEDVRDKDRTKRISIEALGRAVSDALAADRRLSPLSLAEELPPPLALAPPPKKKVSPAASTPSPSVVMADSGVTSSTITAELTEAIKNVQLLYEDMKTTLERQESTAKAMRAEEQAAAEKAFREKLSRYKARLAKYETRLRDGPHSPTPSSPASSLIDGDHSSASPPDPALAHVLQFVVGFLNIGDWMLALFRALLSLVAAQRGTHGTSSCRSQAMARPLRARGAGVSSYCPSTGRVPVSLCTSALQHAMNAPFEGYRPSTEWP